jgi:type I restriction-modification system DNA methylase subunit
MGISKIIDEKQYRIKRNGEIFTPPELANKLLSALPREVWQKDKTFLDPACGDGNLLIAVLQRKIELGHKPLEALKTLYGVDIMPDNVEGCRNRLLQVVSAIEEITSEHKEIVLTNIVNANALEYDFLFAKV